MPLEKHKHGYLLERVGHLGQTFILLSFYKNYTDDSRTEKPAECTPCSMYIPRQFNGQACNRSMQR